MPMVSYAQNAEDVVLARAFAGKERGTYVDVGAAHPNDHSVTRHFYARGWRGLNIEPHPGFFALLQQERPGDVNLDVAVSSERGRATFFVGPHHHPGGSTMSSEVARTLENAGNAMQPLEVEVRTLFDIVTEHLADRDVDFLKIDVEGLEEAVLRGAELERWKPSVVVVEATAPNEPRPSHGPWERLVVDAGYQFCLFDGLNRFYVSDAAPDLVEPVSAPANVFDDWVPFELDDLRAKLVLAEARIAELERARTPQKRRWLSRR